MATTSETPIKHKKGLTKKLVISMLLVGALPLLIGLLLAFYQGTQSIQEVNGASFQALATPMNWLKPDFWPHIPT
jgi:hypothetical protein